MRRDKTRQKLLWANLTFSIFKRTKGVRWDEMGEDETLHLWLKEEMEIPGNGKGSWEKGRREERRWDKKRKEMRKTFGHLNKKNTVLWAFGKKRQDGSKMRQYETLHCLKEERFCANPTFQEVRITLEREEQNRLDRTRWEDMREDEMRQEKRQDKKWLCLMMKKNDWMSWDNTRQQRDIKTNPLCVFFWVFCKRKKRRNGRGEMRREGNENHLMIQIKTSHFEHFTRGNEKCQEWVNWDKKRNEKLCWLIKKELLCAHLARDGLV